MIRPLPAWGPRGAALVRALALALVCLAVLAVAASGSTGSGRARPGRAPGAHAAAAPVPQGFVGMVVDEPVWPDPYVELAPQLNAMVAAGVETLRITVEWSSMQPYRSWKQVPPSERSAFVNAGGVPTDFAALDPIVGLASDRKLKIVMCVLGAPSWDGYLGRGAIVRIPRTPGPYAAFVKALVKRYGPNGSLWNGSSASQYPVRTPVRMWQIWNEPNITPFWPVQPFERRYVALLRAAHQAVKSVDPGAEVVLAGMPNYSWIDLRRIYRVPGSAALFDAVAVHPYTKTPAGVVTILRYVRTVMDQHGDAAKPIIADEISWPSSVGQTDHDTGYDFATTQQGQAQNVAKVIPLLVRDRKALGLAAFFYYDWAGQDRPNYLAFDFSGLWHFHGGQFTAKPAYGAFQTAALAAEGCQSKGQYANSCQNGG